MQAMLFGTTHVLLYEPAPHHWGAWKLQ